MNQPSNLSLKQVYGEAASPQEAAAVEKNAERFRILSDRFLKTYHRAPSGFFSAPGRCELIGNHTDHNGGLVLAASIDMDTIGAAAPNNSSFVRITSEGYPEEIRVDLNDLRSHASAQGTEALVAGMMEAAKARGFFTAGFDAVLSSNVISAAGVSSSASFEMLLCAILNHFFNQDRLTDTDYARIGQYAENVYWHKASGLMDQMACAVGGTVLLDFSRQDQPTCRKIDFSFREAGFQLFIVNTGKGHADLSAEYSRVPREMKEAASALGVARLCETDQAALLSHLSDIQNDRAVLRALHFFEENERVRQAAAAMKQKDSKALLSLIQRSGDSSWKLLQNCFVPQQPQEQKVSLTLALTQLFLERNCASGPASRAGAAPVEQPVSAGAFPFEGAGACRVHGGGFAGVILCIVPLAEAENYVRYISPYVGAENVYPINIRSAGTVYLV